MKKHLLIALLILILGATSASAALIESNVWRGRDVVSLGMSLFGGTGVVSSLDIAIDKQMSFGGSVAVCFENENPYLADFHLNYQFIRPTYRNAMAMSFVGGVWGGTSEGIWVNKNKKDLYIMPELGITITYPLANRVNGRLNLVYGPSFGAEVGFLLHPKLEAVVAVSQQVLGIKFVF